MRIIIILYILISINFFLYFYNYCLDMLKIYGIINIFFSFVITTFNFVLRKQN